VDTHRARRPAAAARAAWVACARGRRRGDGGEPALTGLFLMLLAILVRTLAPLQAGRVPARVTVYTPGSRWRGATGYR